MPLLENSSWSNSSILRCIWSGDAVRFWCNNKPTIIPRGYLWTSPFCFSHASELWCLQGQLHLHLHFLGAVSTESRGSPPAGLVLMLRKLSLTNSALLSVYIFFSRAWAAPLFLGPVNWLLDSGVRCLLCSLGSLSLLFLTLTPPLVLKKSAQRVKLLGQGSRPDHIFGKFECFRKNDFILSCQPETQFRPLCTYSHQPGGWLFKYSLPFPKVVFALSYFHLVTSPRVQSGSSRC